jgi:hypothetical protein
MGWHGLEVWLDCTVCGGVAHGSLKENGLDRLLGSVGCMQMGFEYMPIRGKIS